VLTGDQGRALDVLRGQFGAAGVKEDEEFLVVEADEEAVPEMVRRLVAEGIGVRAVVPASEQGLEDFFLELTYDAGEPARGKRRAGLARLLPGGRR
jgi:hypothetical protein